jgi:hypothetical protein
METDIRIDPQETVTVFWPLTKAATTWLLAHTDATRVGNGFAVEHRYVADILEALQQEGFTVTGFA